MSQLFKLSLVLSGLFTASCTSQQFYQQPLSTGSVAYINIKEDNILQYTMKDFAFMPTYSMRITMIDEKKVINFWDKYPIQISSGPHSITVQCEVSNTLSDERKFHINAKPGKVYTFSYPSSLKGYNFHANPCKLLILS